MKWGSQNAINDIKRGVQNAINDMKRGSQNAIIDIGGTLSERAMS